MKLSEQHIFKGYWWLPDNPDDRVAGVLTYTPSEKISLELIGGFKKGANLIVGLVEDRKKSVPLIYGIDNNAKEFSLLNCSSGFSFNFSSEFPMTRYTVQMVVYDKYVKGLDEVCDYTAHIRYPELSHWAYPAAIEQVLHFNKEGNDIDSCSFNVPHFDSTTESILSVTCDNGVHLSIKRGVGYQPGELFLKPEIEQFSFLELRGADTGMSIRGIFHEMHKFGQFLSLATKRNVRPESIYLTDPDVRQDFKDGAKSFFFPIYILVVQPPVPNPAKIDRDEFLFCYEDISNQLQEILPKWMSDNDNLQPIKSHLVDSLVYKPIVGSVDFLQVIQAIEGVWWRFRDDAYKTAHSIPRRKQTTLHTIIHELLGSLQTIPTISRMEVDIDEVVDSRVYYTHFVDKARRPKVLDDWELYKLTKKMRTVLLCLVLELLGLSHDDIEQILSKH